MIIGNFDTSQRPLVIAEIGNNHEGRIDVARTLVETAADCGVAAVKFQTFRTELYVSRREAERFDRLRRFELTPDQFAELSRLARSLGLLFISTPFDLSSADLLEPIVDAYKISSGDSDFFPLIDRVARTGKPMIVSTGVSNLSRISGAIDCIREARKLNVGQQLKHLALLHCVSSYPVPREHANLRAIQTLKSHFGLPTGYSDHTMGFEACLLAVALGAEIIEKHFTLDNDFSEFRDHHLSLNPDDMKRLVSEVANAHAMLGDGRKAVQLSEAEIAIAIGRSIIVARDVRAGQCLELADLAWVRPAGGLPPGSESKVVGRRLRRALTSGDVVDLVDLE